MGTERRTLTLTRLKISITDSNTILTGMISNASLVVMRALILVLNAMAASEWDSVSGGMFSAVQVSKAAVMQDTRGGSCQVMKQAIDMYAHVKEGWEKVGLICKRRLGLIGRSQLESTPEPFKHPGGLSR